MKTNDTLPETNIVPEKRPGPKRKRSYSLVAPPGAPDLTVGEQARVKYVLQSTGAIGRQDAFDQLTAEKADAFVYQLKGRAPLSIGVRAALAGSVLASLPETISENAMAIPDIIEGPNKLEFT